MSTTEAMVIRPDVRPGPRTREQARQERILDREVRDPRSRLGRLVAAQRARQRLVRRQRRSRVVQSRIGGTGRPPTRAAARASAAVRGARFLNPVALAVTAVAALVIGGTRLLTGQNVDQLGQRATEALLGEQNERSAAALQTRRALGAAPRTATQIARNEGVTGEVASRAQQTFDDAETRARGAEILGEEFSAPTVLDVLAARIELLLREVAGHPTSQRAALNISNTANLAREKRRSQRRVRPTRNF